MNKWYLLSEKEPPIDKEVLVFTFAKQYFIWNRSEWGESLGFYWEDEHGFYQKKDDIKAWRKIPKFE